MNTQRMVQLSRPIGCPFPILPMPDKAWKQVERRFARDVGVERIPVTGERHGADFTDALCSYQVKCRKSIPGWLWTWLSGIQGTAQKSGKAGVLVLKRPRQPDEEAVVILSWREWVELHGAPRSHAGDCNPHVAPCGARFCTYEEMASHMREHDESW